MAASGSFALWAEHFARAVARSDPALVGIGAGSLAAVAAYSAWRAWCSLNNARMIEDIPTAKVRSAPQGYVELEGVGRSMDRSPIIAPLSGLPCVWFRYRVEEMHTTYHRGQTRTRWVTIDRGESTETFWLEDETGRVAVDPEGADVTPRHKDVWHSRSRSAGIRKPGAYVTYFSAALYPNDRYRFTEERINPGETIYAIGLLKNLGSLVAGMTVDEDVRALLRQWKNDQPELRRRFDLNEDGRIDQNEWMLARAQARREALKTRREETNNYDDSINLMTRTGDPKRPYVLSSFPQAVLVRRYRLHAFFAGIAFFLLGSAALWFFNTRFLSGL